MSLTFLICQVKVFLELSPSQVEVSPETLSLFFFIVTHSSLTERVENSLLIQHTVYAKGGAEPIVNSVHELLITNKNTNKLLGLSSFRKISPAQILIQGG